MRRSAFGAGLSFMATVVALHRGDWSLAAILAGSTILLIYLSVEVDRP